MRPFLICHTSFHSLCNIIQLSILHLDSLQNCTRIFRALFEVALKNGWPAMTYKMLKLSKVVDKQIWDFEHPLRQFEGMTFEILQKLEAKKLTMDRMRDMEPNEIGNFLLFFCYFISLFLSYLLVFDFLFFFLISFFRFCIAYTLP